MAEKEFIGSKQPTLFNKFPKDKNTAKEKKQVRKLLVLIFGSVLLATGAAVVYREFPNIKNNIFGSTEVVSQRNFSVSPTPTPTPMFEKEKEAVLQITQPLRGEYGIYFEDLNSGKGFSIKGNTKFESASLNKLPVLLTLYREAEAGRIKLDEVYKIKAEDKRSGAGALQYKQIGFEVTYRQMAEFMAKQSDNTAFNIVSKILGDDKIQLVIDQLGMKNTSFVDWETTPEDIGLYFRKLYKEKIVTDKDRDEIISYLTDTIWEDRIPAGIPKGIKVSHKIGTEIGVISDAGIVFGEKPFILVIMSQNANEIEAGKALPEITKKIFELTNLVVK